MLWLLKEPSPLALASDQRSREGSRMLWLLKDLLLLWLLKDLPLALASDQRLSARMFYDLALKPQVMFVSPSSPVVTFLLSSGKAYVR